MGLSNHKHINTQLFCLQNLWRSHFLETRVLDLLTFMLMPAPSTGTHDFHSLTHSITCNAVTFNFEISLSTHRFREPVPSTYISQQMEPRGNHKSYKIQNVCLPFCSIITFRLSQMNGASQKVLVWY